ncbi:hypothetical protein ABIB94_008345 [Bradyrhizobium sp. JR7.2]|uniref:hypothetical protein n=1 Tax=unclassified Bradyrhizobium TaxID=2631580 RepID=UPI003391FD3E
MVISHSDKIHEATVNLAEMFRQSDVAAAVAAGGGSAAIQAAVRAAEVVFYRKVIASCIARGQSSSNFQQALNAFGLVGG